jgi:ABC-type lipoprotein export system ATPase subunit
MSAVSVSVASALISARGVSVAYGRERARVTALADVELSIREEEAVALLGPSGSGKTTLLHVLGGLTVPSAGSVLWKDDPLSSLDAAARSRARAAGIAYVFQGSNLLPMFTAYENVAFAAWVASHNAHPRARPGSPATIPAESHVPAAELLELVGLSGKRDALPADLSGGEAQRVAIARALAQRPELLLCDEPTGHLDSDTATRVLDLIDRLRERFGFALAIATHDGEVAARCSRLVRLIDGRIESQEQS